jgi:hypothetical protein
MYFYYANRTADLDTKIEERKEFPCKCISSIINHIENI